VPSARGQFSNKFRVGQLECEPVMSQTYASERRRYANFGE